MNNQSDSSQNQFVKSQIILISPQKYSIFKENCLSQLKFNQVLVSTPDNNIYRNDIIQKELLQIVSQAQINDKQTGNILGLRIVLMSNNGQQNQTDKSKRMYTKIQVLEINQNVLFKESNNLKAERPIYLSNNKNNFKNLLDFNFLNKVVNKIHQSIDNFKIQIKQQQQKIKDYQQLIFEQKTKIYYTIKDHIFKQIFNLLVKEFKQFIELINSDSDNDDNQKPFTLNNKNKKLPKQLSKINFYMYMQYVIEGLQLQEQEILPIIEDFLKQQQQNQQLKQIVSDIKQKISQIKQTIKQYLQYLEQYQQNVKNSKQQIKELEKLIFYYNNAEKRLNQIFNLQSNLLDYGEQKKFNLLRTFKMEQNQIREFYEKTYNIYRIANKMQGKIKKMYNSMNHTENIVFYIDYKKLSDILIQKISKVKQNSSVATLVYSYNSICQSCTDRVKYYQMMLDYFTRNRLQEKNSNLFAKRNSAFVQYRYFYSQQHVRKKIQQYSSSFSFSIQVSTKVSFTMNFLFQLRPPSSPEKNFIYNIKEKIPSLNKEKIGRKLTKFHNGTDKDNKPVIKINPQSKN